MRWKRKRWMTPRLFSVHIRIHIPSRQPIFPMSRPQAAPRPGTAKPQGATPPQNMPRRNPGTVPGESVAIPIPRAPPADTPRAREDGILPQAGLLPLLPPRPSQEPLRPARPLPARQRHPRPPAETVPPRTHIQDHRAPCLPPRRPAARAYSQESFGDAPARHTA